METNYYQLAKAILDAENSIRFSSGRWMVNNTLLTDFSDLRDYLFDKYPKLVLSIKKPADSANLEQVRRDYCQKKYGNVDFPPLPIVSEALNNFDEKRKALPKLPLCFKNLTTKQAIIICRLLFFKPSENAAFFLIQGGGGTGKSTFLNIILQLFGNDKAVCDPCNDLGGFRSSSCLTKRLIYNDDIKGDFCDVETLKKVCTSAPVKIEKKFSDAFDIIPQCHAIFLSNPQPSFSINDEGRRRRIVWYQRNHKIENPDPTFVNKKYTHDELIQLVKFLACINYRLVESYQTWEAIKKTYFDKQTHEQIRNCSSLGIWLNQNCNFKGQDYAKTYPDFAQFCKSNGFKCYNILNYRKVLSTLETWQQIDSINLSYIDTDTPLMYDFMLMDENGLPF